MEMGEGRMKRLLYILQSTYTWDGSAVHSKKELVAQYILGGEKFFLKAS